MKKVLLFDFDGVIADSLDLVWFYIKDLFAQKYNFHIKNKDEFLTLFEGNFYHKLIQIGFPEPEINSLITDFSDGLAEIYPKVDIFPNIKELLNNLSKKNEMYIISSSISKPIEKRLVQSGICCFQDILGADKEASKVKKINLIKLVHPKTRLYYVSDTTGDIFETKECKIKSIAVTWGYHSKEKLSKAKPDFIVDNPAQLSKILSKV